MTHLAMAFAIAHPAVIVPPGTDVGTLDMAYRPPAIQRPGLRRRPAGERAAA
jgi:hypothetical protein